MSHASQSAISTCRSVAWKTREISTLGPAERKKSIPLAPVRPGPKIYLTRKKICNLGVWKLQSCEMLLSNMKSKDDFSDLEQRNIDSLVIISIFFVFPFFSRVEKQGKGMSLSVKDFQNRVSQFVLLAPVAGFNNESGSVSTRSTSSKANAR